MLLTSSDSTSKIGFSIIEILIVIALLSTLSAMLFPVFAQVRGKARQATCATNLRQIGMSVAMYAQDYDDLYPNGGDPVDKNTSIWTTSSIAHPDIATLPLLQDILSPYVSSKSVWRCPDDTGFDYVEFQNGADGHALRLNARPSLYEAFGMSYAYHTEIGFRQILYPAHGYSTEPPYAEINGAQINLLEDGNGSWHGGGDSFTGKKYNVLYADGHVKFCDWYKKEAAWQIPLTRNPSLK